MMALMVTNDDVLIQVSGKSHRALLVQSTFSNATEIEFDKVERSVIAVVGRTSARYGTQRPREGVIRDS